jgi:hypothetical protein
LTSLALLGWAFAVLRACSDLAEGAAVAALGLAAGAGAGAGAGAEVTPVMLEMLLINSCRSIV